MHTDRMRKTIAVVGITTVAALGLIAPANAVATSEPAPRIVAAAAAKPGQFCKKADRGVVRKTKAYGKLKCKKDGRYSRWKRV